MPKWRKQKGEFRTYTHWTMGYHGWSWLTKLLADQPSKRIFTLGRFLRHQYVIKDVDQW